MSLGNKSWNDKVENYGDGYNLVLSGTIATGVYGTQLQQPVVVYAITVTLSQNAGASGSVVLVDGSATADSGDPRRFTSVFASGQNSVLVQNFPRGIVFNSGCIVSATTVTGALNLNCIARYS